MDIALAVQEIYPNADFRRSDTYGNLWNTWKDKRTIPSMAQLEEAWGIVQQKQFEQSIQDAAHVDHMLILHDDWLLGQMTYEQRMDLLTNILRHVFPET